jgi:hypothetical protein
VPEYWAHLISPPAADSGHRTAERGITCLSSGKIVALV